MQNKKSSRFFENLRPYFSLILFVVFFAVATKGDSLSLKNIKTVTEQSMSLILATVGVFFVMTTGMMDLSISGIVCCCCYVLAKACTWNIPLGLLLTLLTGVGLGAFNGFVTSVLKIPSFLATLCTAYICTGIMTSLIASSSAIVPFELYAVNTFRFKLIMVVVLILFAYFIFRRLPFGSYVRLIGSNETAANYCTIDTIKVRILCYVVDGAFAACAAFLIGIRAGTAALSSGSDLMFNVMVALTLGSFPFTGGTGVKLTSAVVGSITAYVLSNGMLLLGVGTTAMMMIKGFIILLIVLLTSPTFKKIINRIKPKTN